LLCLGHARRLSRLFPPSSLAAFLNKWTKWTLCV
jgi:hypothetical protein